MKRKIIIILASILLVTSKIYGKESELRYSFTDDEIYLMGQLLSGDKSIDGDGEYDIDYENEDNIEQIYLVLNVVMNRVMSNDWPNTVEEVITQKGQFEVMPQNLDTEVSDITLKIVTEWCQLYDNWNESAKVIPESHMFFSGDNFKNWSRKTWK